MAGPNFLEWEEMCVFLWPLEAGRSLGGFHDMILYLLFSPFLHVFVFAFCFPVSFLSQTGNVWSTAAMCIWVDIDTFASWGVTHPTHTPQQSRHHLALSFDNVPPRALYTDPTPPPHPTPHTPGRLAPFPFAFWQAPSIDGGRWWHLSSPEENLPHSAQSLPSIQFNKFNWFEPVGS